MSAQQWVDRATALVAAIRRPLAFPVSARIDFYENMSTLRRANVVTREALASMVEVNSMLGRNRQSAFFARLRDRLESGAPLSSALRDLVPPSEAMVLAAGERSDSAEGFDGAVRIARGSRAMAGALLKSMSYPLVLLLAAFGLVITISKMLLPEIEKMLGSRTIDDPVSVAYIAMARFVQSEWPLVVAVLVVALVILLGSFPRWFGPLRTYADKYAPPYVLYRLYSCAGFLIALSALTRTHMPLKEALEHLHGSAPPYLAAHIRKMLATIVAGRGESAAFSTGLLPDSTIIRIHALARSGGVSGALTATGADIVDFCVTAMGAAGAMFLGAVLALVCLIAVWTLYFFYSLDPGSALAG